MDMIFSFFVGIIIIVALTKLFKYLLKQLRRHVSKIEAKDSETCSYYASIETMIIIVVSLFITISFDTFRWFAISCCIAPLVLLRSEQSLSLGATWFESCFNYVVRLPLIFRLTFVLFLPMISIGIRVVASLRHVKNGLWSFPKNWKNTVWSRSVFGKLEFVPGTGTVLQNIEKLNLPHAAGAVVSFGFIFLFFLYIGFMDEFVLSPFIEKVVFGILVVFLIIGMSFLSSGIVAWIGLMMAFSYRFSLKATALIWMPLLFALNESRYSVSADRLIALEKSSNTWGLIRAASFLTILAMAYKVIFVPTLSEFSNPALGIIVNTYLTPNEIYLWQLTSTLNAIFALAWYYIFIDQAERNMNFGIDSRGDSIVRWFKIFYVLRAALSTYTIPVLLLITLNTAQLVSVKIPIITKPLPFERPSDVFRV